MHWNFASVKTLISVAFIGVASCEEAAGQVNGWQNPYSGQWEVASNWSLGLRPGPGQSVLITNAGWKAVAIGPNAANNYPESLSVQTVTLSAPPDSFNVLLLNYAGSTPVRAYTVAVQTNAALTVLDSMLLVTNTGNSDFRIEVGGTVNQGANASVATGFLSLGNIGPGVYNMTNGTLTGGIEYIGGSFPGLVEQFGGSNWAGLLRIQAPWWYQEGGRYELHDGSLGGTVQLYQGGVLLQTGGCFNGDIEFDGFYVLEGGLYTNASMVMPDHMDDYGSVLQTGGTNQVGALSVGVDGAIGGAYTLSNGAVVASAAGMASSTLAQYGGTLTVNGPLRLSGGWFSRPGYSERLYGSHWLEGGSAFEDALDLSGIAYVCQTGGSNYVAGGLTIGNDQADTDAYALVGGTLVCSNVTIHGWGWSYFANQGGTHVVREVLHITGWLEPGYGTNYYILTGGQLSAREIRVDNEGWFIHQAGALLNSPMLTLSNGYWQAAPGFTQFGPIQGSGSIYFPTGQCILSFSNSTAAPDGLTIYGWNGSPGGGGQHQIRFGPGRLTSQQLLGIHFIRPDCFTCEFRPPRQLPDGEVVPAQVLEPRRLGGEMVLQWELGGILQTATNVAGPYTDLRGATSPYTNRFSDPQRFFRLRQPPTITVTNREDSGPGSLRQAIANAPDSSIINLPAGGNITLTSGELLITNDLTLVGPGATNLTISGNTNSRIFEIGSNANVCISGLTLAQGHAPDGGFISYPLGQYPPPPPGADGGAIYNSGHLTLSHCTLLKNSAGNGGQAYYHAVGYDETRAGPGGAGGAVYNAGSLTAIDCLLVSNFSGSGADGGLAVSNDGIEGPNPGADAGSGGAICNWGVVVLTNCTFVRNSGGNGGYGTIVGCVGCDCAASSGRGGAGGAIANFGALSLVSSALIANRAGTNGGGGQLFLFGGLSPAGGGGGLCNLGSASLNFCTFHLNAAAEGISRPLDATDSGGSGGAICNTSTLSAFACTFDSNSAGRGSDGIVSRNDCGQLMVGPGGNGGSGGAVANSGELFLTNCTFAANNSGAGGNGASGASIGYDGAPGGNGGAGGAVYNGTGEPRYYGGQPPAGTGTLVACTISQNWAGAGGIGGSNAPPFYGPPSAPNGTNGSAGGICNAVSCPTCPQPSVQVLNSLVAANTTSNSGPDALGAFFSLGHNLLGRADSATGFTNGVNGDLVGSIDMPIDPVLGPLLDNGGPLPTMALLHGSPAIDSGDDRLLGPPFNLTNDERGFPRLSGRHIDIGAFEFQFGAQAPTLFDVSATPAGQFGFAFTSGTAGATFSILSTTNISLPISAWTVLGQATPIGPTQFQFRDDQTSSNSQQFYRLSSP